MFTISDFRRFPGRGPPDTRGSFWAHTYVGAPSPRFAHAFPSAKEKSQITAQSTDIIDTLLSQKENNHVNG